MIKISNKPTNYIAIKCANNTEWDDTTHFIIGIDKEEIQKIVNLGNQMLSLNYTESVADVTFYYNNIVIHIFDEDENPEFFQDESFYFLDITEFPDVISDDEKLGVQLIVMNTPHRFYFKGYGKYSGTEFYTDTVNLNEL